MPIVNPYDPFGLFIKFNGLWEKQINDFNSLLFKQSEFIKVPKQEADSHFRMLDLFRKNQEAFASIMNRPAKSELTRLEKLNSAAIEKIESLEDQISSLRDSINNTNKEIDSIIDVSKQMIKLTKQLKTELKKTKKELAESKQFQTNLLNMNQELAQLNSFKEEMEIVKSLIDKGEQKEPALSGSGQNQPK